MVKGPPGDRDVLLKQWKVRTLGNGGTRREEARVHCPLKVNAENVEECEACSRRKGEVTLGAHRYLECSLPAELVKPAGVAGELIGGDVTTLESDLNARDALRVLEATAAASVLVVDDNQVPVGQVFASGLARLRDVEDRDVDDAMVMRVVTATTATPIAEVASLMLSHELESLPLVDAEGRLVGVVTALDLIRWYSKK
jgi:CBS domain-containing protein